MVSYRVNTLNLNIWRSTTRLWAFDRKQRHLLQVMPSWVSISLHWRCFVIKRGDVSCIDKDIWWWQLWWLIFEFKGQIRPPGKDVGNMEIACTVNRPRNRETNFIVHHGIQRGVVYWCCTDVAQLDTHYFCLGSSLWRNLSPAYKPVATIHAYSHDFIGGSGTLLLSLALFVWQRTTVGNVIENPRFCGVSLPLKETPDTYKSQAGRGRGLSFGCQFAISRTILYRCIS